MYEPVIFDMDPFGGQKDLCTRFQLVFADFARVALVHVGAWARAARRGGFNVRGVCQISGAGARRAAGGGLFPFVRVYLPRRVCVAGGRPLIGAS